MATTKKLLKQFNVSASMAKRLAQLDAGITPNYGTSMGALVERGMVEVIPGECGGTRKLTALGRETIDGLRAAGW